MLKQTLAKYKTIKLGNGSGSIYDYGCYLVSLVDGLQRHGYTFTPEVFNQVLKDKGLWFGEFGNYIDVDNIAKKWSEVFVSFKSVAPFTTQSIPLDDTHVVLAKVDARPIGGTGSHFVEVLRMEGAYAIIGDPCFGDEVRAFDRYGKYGTLKELRIFEIKKGAVGSQGGTSMTNMYGGLDLANPDSMKVCVDAFNAIKNGEYVKKADAQAQADAAKKAGYDHGKSDGFNEGKASVPAPTPAQSGSVNMDEWKVNGLQISHVEGDKTITLNYDKK